jgi:L-ascorbate metabolism protein UlaG (beta-lactamase superfamily)
MEIIWLGHACFRLRSQETVVITDPFPNTIGLDFANRPASVVTISHTDPNHSNSQDVAGNPKIFSAPGEYEFSNISVKGVMTPLADNSSREHRNVAYTITIEGIRICHLGALRTPLTTSHIDELGSVDVLLVPVGGHGLVELSLIQQLMRDIDPKIVVPMQYNIPGLALDLDPVDAFLTQQSSGEIQSHPRLSVTTTNLPESVTLSLLTPQSQAT